LAESPDDEGAEQSPQTSAGDTVSRLHSGYVLRGNSQNHGDYSENCAERSKGSPQHVAKIRSAGFQKKRSNGVPAFLSGKGGYLEPATVVYLMSEYLPFE